MTVLTGLVNQRPVPIIIPTSWARGSWVFAELQHKRLHICNERTTIGVHLALSENV